MTLASDCPYWLRLRTSALSLMNYLFMAPVRVYACRDLGSGYTTFTLPQVAHEIAKDDLEPGDIMLNVQDHVVLFAGWADASKTSYWCYQGMVARIVLASAQYELHLLRCNTNLQNRGVILSARITRSRASFRTHLANPRTFSSLTARMACNSSRIGARTIKRSQASCP